MLDDTSTNDSSLATIVVVGFIALSVADFCVVGRGRRSDTAEVEPVNWAGVLTLAFASIVAYALVRTGVFPFGFVTSTVVVLVVYPVVRSRLIKQRVRGIEPAVAAS